MKNLQQLTKDNADNLRELQVLLRYEFADTVLLQQALIHSSYGFEKNLAGKNNETLEFLGDAVLDLAVSDMLFKTYQGVTEGELTKMRAGLVRETTLAEMARALTLGDFLMLGKGEESSHGRGKASILSSAFEALIGAIYLDRGYEIALKLVSTHFVSFLPAKKEKILVDDAKSLLQEKLQEQFNQAPNYNLDKEEGPGHAKNFTVSVRFKDEVLGTGSGSSKKVAEQRAAAAALDAIDSWWEQLKSANHQS